MAALALSKKGMPTSSRDKDMEEELRKLADEEIMDRTPILDVCIEKWRAINNIKKTSIKIFHDNSCKIREALNGLTSYIGLDSFEELPLVYKKTEQQMSNINIYKEKLETQNEESLKMKNELEKDKAFKEAFDKLNEEFNEVKNKNNALKEENEKLKKESEQKMKDVKEANQAANKLKVIMDEIKNMTPPS